MSLKNITLKTAELGPVNWEDVEKLQPGENGFICFVTCSTVIKTDEEGNEVNMLVGEYIPTTFNYKPSYKELINYIIQCEYPDGKENQMLRYGIYDPNDEEYLEYYDHVEQISREIKNLLK